MPLTPKEVNFDQTWVKIKNTMNSVIMMGEASNAKLMEHKRADWNDRFKYPFVSGIPNTAQQSYTKLNNIT